MAFRDALASSTAGGSSEARVAVGEAVLRAGRRLENDELRRLALLAIVDADASRIDAWQGLASFEESHGGDPAAIYRRLLDERPDDAAAHVAWARHLASENRPDEASGSLRLAIERGVAPPVLLGALAAVQLERGDRDAARATIEELEKDHPDHPRTTLAIAQAALYDGNALEAAEKLRFLVGTHESSEADRLLALAELRSGSREAAAAAIDRALELAPASVEAHRLRARIPIRVGPIRGGARGVRDPRPREPALQRGEAVPRPLPLRDGGSHGRPESSRDTVRVRPALHPGCPRARPTRGEAGSGGGRAGAGAGRGGGAQRSGRAAPAHAPRPPGR